MEIEKIPEPQQVNKPEPSNDMQHKALIKGLYPDANNGELHKLWYLSQQYDLDPVKSEIYIIRYAGKPSYVIGSAGYLKITNGHTDFNSLESDTIYEGNELTKEKIAIYSSNIV